MSGDHLSRHAKVGASPRWWLDREEAFVMTVHTMVIASRLGSGRLRTS